MTLEPQPAVDEEAVRFAAYIKTEAEKSAKKLGLTSLIGLDDRPSAVAAAPQGATNVLRSVAERAAFAISFTPYCGVTVDRIFIPRSVARHITISSIEIGGQNFLYSGGDVPGESFASLAGDSPVSLISVQPSNPNNPIVLRGNVIRPRKILRLRAMVVVRRALQCAQVNQF
jgi:hypothetical protein